MEVGIVAQKGNRRAGFLADDVRTGLPAEGVSVRLEENTAAMLDESGVPVETLSGADLVVSIGGDGTFLFAARAVEDAPMVGVNLGEVGFLNAVSPTDAVETVRGLVDDYRDGGLDTRDVPRIAARSDGWTGQPAVNEVVVQGSRRGRGGGVGVEIRVNGSLYSSGHADGVLVSTPTGSTAYNLSERGPLLHPRVEGLVVTEMCAGEGMPPLVVPPEATVTVGLSDGEEAVVVSDGRSTKRVQVPTDVSVATTDPPLRIAGPASDFFEALGKLD